MHLTGIEIDDVLIGVIIYYIQMAFPALGRNLPSFEVPLVESGSIGEDTPCGIMKQLALEYTVKDYSRVPEYKGGRTNTAWGSCAMLSYRCGWVCLRHRVEEAETGRSLVFSSLLGSRPRRNPTSEKRGRAVWILVFCFQWGATGESRLAMVWSCLHLGKFLPIQTKMSILGMRWEEWGWASWSYIMPII